jgi:hypothetical protein
MSQQTRTSTHECCHAFVQLKGVLQEMIACCLTSHKPVCLQVEAAAVRLVSEEGSHLPFQQADH